MNDEPLEESRRVYGKWIPRRALARFEQLEPRAGGDRGSAPKITIHLAQLWADSFGRRLDPQVRRYLPDDDGPRDGKGSGNP